MFEPQWDDNDNDKDNSVQQQLQSHRLVSYLDSSLTSSFFSRSSALEPAASTLKLPPDPSLRCRLSLAPPPTYHTCVSFSCSICKFLVRKFLVLNIAR